MMKRVYFLLIFSALFALNSQVKGDDLNTVFERPFLPHSPSRGSTDLIVMVLTDDDPYRTDSPSDADARRLPWCAAEVADSFREMLDVRNGQGSALTLQSYPVGLPQELTGGQPRATPGRAVTVVCDASYRVLSFAVGVPDSDQLISMVEDAEETRSIWEQQTRGMNANVAIDAPTIAMRSLVDRNATRVHRFYQAAMLQMVESLSGTAEDSNESSLQGETSEPLLLQTEDQIHRVCDMMDSIYLADVKLRFGLSNPDDLKRLVILEHHPQTRFAWCQSVAPAVVCQDVRAGFMAVVESVWGFPPIQPELSANKKSVSALMPWVQSRSTTESIVFSIRPTAKLRDSAWPPLDIVNPKRPRKRSIKSDWKKADQAAKGKSYLKVDLLALSEIIRQMNLRPILWPIISNPNAVARYAVLPSGSRKLVVIHANDSPGKLTGLVNASP